VAQSLSCVLLFETPWNAARQASMSITNSWSLLRLMSIELVMPSNHLILCRPILLPPSVFPRMKNFADKSLCSQSYGFSNSVQMWELGRKEGWVPKNWYFRIVLLKTLESPLDNKIKPVNPKGNQPWIFTGRTDAEAEAPILWPPDVKNWLIGKDPDAGKDWGWEENGTTENEMVGWHHQLYRHKSE